MSSPVGLRSCLYDPPALESVMAAMASKHPDEVSVDTLVDRCVVRLPVAPSDIIECHVPPYESAFQIQCVQTERKP